MYQRTGDVVIADCRVLGRRRWVDRFRDKRPGRIVPERDTKPRAVGRSISDNLDSRMHRPSPRLTVRGRKDNGGKAKSSARRPARRNAAAVRTNGIRKGKTAEIVARSG